MYVLSLNMWFQKLMRQFFFAIDKIVYNFISDIYDLLISIARTSVLTQADIIDMADRIYKLLAVFMVFKVTFSLIMYVVNPDDFSDKSKGVSKLITNVGMSLSLLILTPYIFNYAYQLQTIVLEDNSLAALVFGDDANADESHFSTAGDDMAYITISPFFSPNLALTPLQQSCDDLSVNENGDRKFNSTCKTSLESLLDDKTDFDSVTLNNYITGFEYKSLGLMYRQDIAIATTTKGGTNSEEFVMDYKYIFSTVVGIVIVLLLLSFCMDVAVRSIKLAFLQLVAPIPIISVIDPKSGKDGLFKKWYQMCFKTYLSLFIRLIALYFAVYIIGRVADMKMVDIVDGSYVSNGFISIFIIIGALMFAKQLPKLLEGLGIKLDSDSKFTLNPLKKFSDNALGGKRLTGAAGGLTAALADRSARIATAPGMANKLKALGGAPLGVLGGAIRGSKSKDGFRGGLEKQSAVNRRLREGRINGLSPVASYLDYAGSIFGLDDATLEKEGTLVRKNDDIIRNAEDELSEKNRGRTVRINEEKKIQATRKNTRDKFENIRKQGERLIKASEDFTVKKGNFENKVEYDAKIKQLKNDMDVAKNKGLSQIEVGKDRKGNAIYQSLDEYYTRQSRSINARNYKENRDADEANVQYLTNNNGETIAKSFMVGNEFFEAGTSIDGSVIARAKEAQGKYIKQSQKDVTNEMEKINNIAAKSSRGETLTQDESDYFDNVKDFYDKNKSDFQSFENIKTEFETARDEANSFVDIYNSEYSASMNKIDYNNYKNDNSFYSNVKDVIGDMETGAGITEINNELAKSQAEIERLESENEAAVREIRVDFYDEYGRKLENKISLEDAKSRNKTRDENHKRNVKKHQERRSLAQTMHDKKR